MSIVRVDATVLGMVAGALDVVPPALVAIAVAQDFVVGRHQLAAAGVTRARTEANVAARRWQVFGRRGVVLHNAELSPAQRLWLPIVMLDQPAALAGPTAAQAAGLTGFVDKDAVHIVVVRACEARLPRWVKVHNSRRFTAADINPVATPPRTRAARSLIDTAAWSQWPRRACAVLCAGVQQRLVTAEHLTAELAAAGQVRHAAVMRSVLGDIGGGGHTLGELDLGPLAARAGLAAPVRQALRREPGGGVRYVDAEFTLHDGATLVVEIDGAVHLNALSWWDDQRRQNEFVIGGDLVLRFDSVTVRLEPQRVVDQLRRLASRHGTRR